MPLQTFHALFFGNVVHGDQITVRDALHIKSGFFVAIGNERELLGTLKVFVVWEVCGLDRCGDTTKLFNFGGQCVSKNKQCSIILWFRFCDAWLFMAFGAGLGDAGQLFQVVF